MTVQTPDNDNDATLSREAKVALYLAIVEKERRLRREEAPAIARALKTLLFPAMQRLRLARARISYEGWADEGGIETVELIRTDGSKVGDTDPEWQAPVPAVARITEKPDVNVRAILEDITWWLLETFHDGWENNEGAMGEVSLDFTNGEISLEHRTRQYSYESEARHL